MTPAEHARQIMALTAAYWQVKPRQRRQPAPRRQSSGPPVLAAAGAMRKDLPGTMQRVLCGRP
ncbi:MAG: hypothetical protein AB7G13_00540 [Lautropia sp.]